MDTFLLIALTVLAIFTAALFLLGQRRHWGVAPVGLLGLGLVVPIGLLLVGAL